MTHFDDPGHDDFREYVLPVLRVMALEELHEASGIGLSALKEIRAGRSRPRPRNRAALTAIAVCEARARLGVAGAEVPRDDLAALHAFGVSLAGWARACPMCGEPLTSDRATYCSARCRKRASRAD